MTLLSSINRLIFEVSLACRRVAGGSSRDIISPLSPLSIKNGVWRSNLSISAWNGPSGRLLFPVRLRKMTATSTNKEIQMQDDFVKAFKDIENRIGLLRRFL
jgi:hypothetical protein